MGFNSEIKGLNEVRLTGSPAQLPQLVTNFGENNYSYENNQQDALYRLICYSKPVLHVAGDVFAHNQEYLTVFTVSGTVSGTFHICFGRCFRPSSRALDCIYSIWQCSPKLLSAGVPNELKLNYVDCEASIHASQST